MHPVLLQDVSPPLCVMLIPTVTLGIFLNFPFRRAQTTSCVGHEEGAKDDPQAKRWKRISYWILLPEHDRAVVVAVVISETFLSWATVWGGMI